MGVIYSTITFGVSAYHRVQIQNSLRDEGDLVMSSMMTKLYTYGPDKLVQTSDGIQLLSGLAEQKTEMKFQRDERGTGQLIIADQPLQLSSSLVTGGADGSAIVLSCRGGAQACGSGLLTIRLKLLQSYGGRDYTLNLESKFGF